MSLSWHTCYPASVGGCRRPLGVALDSARTSPRCTPPRTRTHSARPSGLPLSLRPGTGCLLPRHSKPIRSTLFSSYSNEMCKCTPFSSRKAVFCSRTWNNVTNVTIRPMPSDFAFRTSFYRVYLQRLVA